MPDSKKRNYSLFSMDSDEIGTITELISEEQVTCGDNRSTKRKYLSTVEYADAACDKTFQTTLDRHSCAKEGEIVGLSDDAYTCSSQEAGDHDVEGDNDSDSDVESIDYDDSILKIDEDNKPSSKRARYRSLDDFRDLRAEFLQQFMRLLCPLSQEISLCTSCYERGPSLRCLDCFHFRIRCQICILREHTHHPLHRPQYFDGYTWRRTSLRSLGLKVHLGHKGKACPSLSHSTDLKTITVIDIKGIQEVEVSFCVCDKIIGVDAMERSQLIQHGWFPATTEHPRTVASFSTLDVFEALSGEGKMSGYHFYRCLVRLRDGSGCETIPKRYEEFMRMTREYQHIKMLQRAGKVCSLDEDLEIEDGELAVECPACPHPQRNLPEDWDKRVDSWIYTLFIMIDANFRLKLKKKRTLGDSDLGEGGSYFVRDEPYKDFLKDAVEEKEIKYCDSGLRAVDHASLKGGKGYEASGVVGVQCRHMLIRKNGMGDLQRGEKYANVDYVVLSSLKNVDLKRITLSYDINCQYSRNFSKRMLKFDKNMRLDLSKVSMEFVIPQFHIAGHGESCRNSYNLRFREHVGRTDGENIERGWAAFNPLSMASKEMGSGARRDYLDWHIGDWNYQRILTFGLLFSKKLREAVAESVKHTDAMIELRKSFSKGIVREIEYGIKQWDKDRINSPNPYAKRQHGVLLLKTRQILTQAESTEENAEILQFANMSATHWLTVGLELEESQRHAKKTYKISKKDNVTLVDTTAMEKNSATVRKMRAWKGQQLLYMPGLVNYELWDSMQDDAKNYSHCWTVALNLPSSISPSRRDTVCSRLLTDKEYKLREAQANDSLDEIRLILQKQWWLTSKKKKHVSSGPGQTRLTKSNYGLQVMMEEREKHVNCYRRARAALLSLRPDGDWQTRLKPLKDEDLRPMEDDDGKGEGRRVLSWIWSMDGAVPPGKEGEVIYEGLKVEYAKSRARSQRWLEEVQLLKEEMRRVLCYFNWKIEWWTESISRLRECVSMANEVMIGFVIYANQQALILQCLGNKFRSIWTIECEVKDLPDIRNDQCFVLGVESFPAFEYTELDKKLVSEEDGQ